MRYVGAAVEMGQVRENDQSGRKEWTESDGKSVSVLLQSRRFKRTPKKQRSLLTEWRLTGRERVLKVRSQPPGRPRSRRENARAGGAARRSSSKFRRILSSRGADRGRVFCSCEHASRLQHDPKLGPTRQSRAGRARTALDTGTRERAHRSCAGIGHDRALSRRRRPFEVERVRLSRRPPPVGLISALARRGGATSPSSATSRHCLPANRSSSRGHDLVTCSGAKRDAGTGWRVRK